jgi:hypothetical protein
MGQLLDIDANRPGHGRTSHKKVGG